MVGEGPAGCSWLVPGMVPLDCTDQASFLGTVLGGRRDKRLASLNQRARVQGASQILSGDVTDGQLDLKGI